VGVRLKLDSRTGILMVVFRQRDGETDRPEAPWFWVIVAEGFTPSWLMDRGYAVSREQALAEFRARWILNDLVCPRIADLPTPTMPAFIVRCVRCNAQIWVALNSSSDVRRICSRCAKSV
jgi:hypothetical protein